jgi:hypothetical protein
MEKDLLIGTAIRRRPWQAKAWSLNVGAVLKAAIPLKATTNAIVPEQAAASNNVFRGLQWPLCWRNLSRVFVMSDWRLTVVW